VLGTSVLVPLDLEYLHINRPTFSPSDIASGGKRRRTAVFTINLQTTGLDTNRDRIIEFAAIRLLRDSTVSCFDWGAPVRLGCQSLGRVYVLCMLPAGLQAGKHACICRHVSIHRP
jgi:hypothetical protein